MVKFEHDSGVAHRHPFINATFGGSGSNLNVELALLKLAELLPLGTFSSTLGSLFIDVIDNVLRNVSLILFRLTSLESERFMGSFRFRETVLADLEGGSRLCKEVEDFETLRAGALGESIIE